MKSDYDRRSKMAEEVNTMSAVSHDHIKIIIINNLEKQLKTS